MLIHENQTQCTHPAQALDANTCQTLLSLDSMKLAGWQYHEGGIEKNFVLPNHYALMAFVNAVAWVSHQCNHHPDISYAYKSCRVRYTTHDTGGLSWNDVICAQHVNALQAIR